MSPQKHAHVVAPTTHDELQHPTLETPCIPHDRLREGYTGAISSFGDSLWDVSPIGKPNKNYKKLHWESWPEAFVDLGKHTAYAFIANGTPESLHEKLGTSATKWPSPTTILHWSQALRRIIEWWLNEWPQLHPDHPTIRNPQDLDKGHMNDARDWIDNHPEWAPGHKQTYRRALVLAWHLNPWLPDHLQWPEPEWRDDNDGPKQRPSGENTTQAIGSETFIPLLTWATAFVTEFSRDIIDAQWHYNQKTRKLKKLSGREMAKLFQKYVNEQRTLPVLPDWKPRRKNSKGIAWHAMEYRHGYHCDSFSSAYQGWKFHGKIPMDTTSQGTAVNSPVRGRIFGHPWTPSIDVYDLISTARSGDQSRLIRALHTACLIVIAALSGMRPEEVLDLKVGCAPEAVPAPDGVTLIHVINGHVYKNIRAAAEDDPGEAKPATWAVVPIVHDAIRILEEIHALQGKRHAKGKNATTYLFSETGERFWLQTATARIKEFIAYVNERLAPHTPKPTKALIPNDPYGNVVLRRFRRTLAWHIRNQPQGDVTLAIQFQHVGVTIGQGYAGTKQSGMPDERLQIDWEHRQRMLTNIREAWDTGMNLYGPAAPALIQIIQKPEVVTEQEVRRIKKATTAPLYDNPGALTLCLYREENALCEKLKLRGADTQPNLLDCRSGCLNQCGTDEHLEAKRHEIDELTQQLPLLPKPAQLSAQQRINDIQKDIDRFESTPHNKDQQS